MDYNTFKKVLGSQQMSFATNNWTFPWMQGNWDIEALTGNPSPSAVFPGNPNQTNYINALLSPWFDAASLSCDNVYLNFDLKLSISNPSRTKGLDVILEYIITEPGG